jgi:FixJ family two-component response regulator
VRPGQPAQVVYIVDDDASVRKGLARLMRSAGYRVHVFETGDDFLAGVGLDSEGCVILDITMPRISGQQVQALMLQRNIQLPVIALSAKDDEDTRRNARALGARFFLRKPVDDQAILDTIQWVSDAGRRSSPDDP